MKGRFYFVCLATFAITLAYANAQTKTDSGVPHLEKRGAAKQLVVDGKSFLALAVELNNSSTSNFTAIIE